MTKRVAIVGIGQTPHKSRMPEYSAGEMINLAVRAALEDAQISKRDVDQVLLSNMEHFEGNYLVEGMFSDYVGSYLKPGLKVQVMGTTGASMVSAAWYFVASGLFDTVLTVAYQKQHEGHSGAVLQSAAEPAYDRIMTGHAAMYVQASLSQHYMNETGCRPEHAAMVRVKASDNGRRNPFAHLKLNLTVEDVTNSRVLVWPLRYLDICPTSAGACALVLASGERARKITDKPVWIKDHVAVHQESFTLSVMHYYPDPFPRETTREVASKKICARNGITNLAREIDVFEIYEPSTYGELQYMEDLGICGRGEAWKLVERGATTLEGEVPVNPSGGVLSTNAIGDCAMMRVAEAALQVRGDAGEHQVTRRVNTALAHGFGGRGYTTLHLLSKTP